MGDIRQQVPDEVIKAGSTAAVANDPSLVVALSPNSPLPAGANSIGSVIVTSTPDGVGSGTITAADIVVAAPINNGVTVSGASTAGSYVTLLCPGGDSAWTIQMLGAFGGTTLYFEESVDSTTGVDGNWINVNGRQTGVVNTVLSGNATSTGFYRGNTAGAKYIRVRAVGGASISVGIVMRMSAGSGALFLNASIPAGNNIIGKVSIDQTTPGTTNAVSVTNTALAVQPVQSTNTTGAIIAATTIVGPIAANNQSIASVVLSGTYAGISVLFEGSLDNVVWYGITGFFPANGISGNGFFGAANSIQMADVPLGAYSFFRVRATAWTSGSGAIAIALKAIGPSPFCATVPQGTSQNATVTYSNPVLVGGSDGTNARYLAVKAPSVAPVATDQALVVGLSPNSPLPTGANVVGTVSVQGLGLAGTSASIAAAGTGTVGPLAVGTAGNCTFTIKNTVSASAYAGNPVVVFEQSDNNVDWGPLMVVRNDTYAAGTTFTLNPNTAAGELTFDGALEGINYVRARVTTGPVTNAMTIAIAAGGLPFVNVISAVQQPLTKGTQGVSGVTTQDLKDSGRVNIAITAYQAAGIITTEALFAAATFSSSRDGAAATTGTQFTVTAGKRFRIQAIECSIKNTAAAAGTSKLALRYSGVGGTIAITSPILALWDLGSNNAVAGNYIGPMVLAIPDGIELLPNSTFGFTNLSSAATMLHTITMSGYEY